MKEDNNGSKSARTGASSSSWERPHGAPTTEAMVRTPRPSDCEHAIILMKRNLRADLSQKRLWFARTFIACFMVMLWTMGFFFNYPEIDNGNTVAEGGYLMHPAEPWQLPAYMVLAGAAAVGEDLPRAVQEHLQDWIPKIHVVSGVNVSDFKIQCETLLGGSADAVGVFLESNLSYGLYFEGGVSPPFRPVLAGAQWAVNSAILNISSVQHYDVASLQRTPEKIVDGEDYRMPAPSVFLIIGVLLALSVAIMQMFLLGPMLKEKLQGVVQALVLVGVKKKIYMLQWAIYYSIMGVFTAAGMTVLSIFWKLYPLSNPGLLFMSHFLAIAQTSVLSSLIAQIVNQEELANGVPWLMGFGSMAIAVPILILDVAKWALPLCTVFSPSVGIIAYSSVYAAYDAWGYSMTGVQPGLNVASSGLLAISLAQVAGIGFWVLVIIFFSRPSKRKRNDDPEADGATIEGGNFEPLPPDAEIIVSIRSLCHSFTTGCIKKSQPADVLRGLNMDICRNEVYAFLGHNGAGKTTTIRILSGEIRMDSGEATYHFPSDSLRISDGDMNELRGRIGVCPQHNVVIGNLTCRETLQLFASLKGRISIKHGQSKKEAIDDEVDRRIADLKFEEGDADKPVKTFSGGMKRRVCIAISLLGDPEVVFLDEPTAGCDPFTRRQVWDMIIEAKKGRSIVLTTHFLDEADILSDRVGIISKGQLLTCGTSLFLKHHFGVGYSLSYDCRHPVDLACLVPDAKDVSTQKKGGKAYCWELPHGAEPSFPEVLRVLEAAGATNVSLDLTTLEEVFLATEEEATDGNNESRDPSVDSKTEPNNVERYSGDAENGSSHDGDAEGALSNVDLQAMIWEPRGEIKQVSLWRRLSLIQHFMMGNAWKTKGTVSLNVIMPLIYLLTCLIVVRVVGVAEEGERKMADDINISPHLVSKQSGFFGLPELSVHSIAPLIPADEPESIEDFFVVGALPTIGGYWADNRTLQYNSTMSPFALQIGEGLIANYSLWLEDKADGISARLVQLPYDQNVFRIDLLLVPMGLSFGLVGMAYSVLDVLILKSNNIHRLFRVAGISEWIVSLGICWYKCVTTFVPFFVLVVALGIGLESVAFGNGGRWLGTLLLLLLYAFSVTPLGLIFATNLNDFKAVSNWFPGVYMTSVSLPFSAWVLALQLLPQARNVIMIIGDVLCIIPPFAFQRGIGAVMEVSTSFNDPELSWGRVWSWESRIWFVQLLMLTIGTFEWWYLRRRTTIRPAMAKLSDDDAIAAEPVDISGEADLTEEHARSVADNFGIKARELVKVFQVPFKKRSRKTRLKTAVAGISFGVSEGEIYALVGPNGAGKSVTMSLFSAEYTQEHGEIALDGECASQHDKRVARLYSKSTVSIVPQFDALFPQKTVHEHLKFYARVRGLDFTATSTQDHIQAIVDLLGLNEHLGKESEALSGGFKRRLSLAVALVGYPKCLLLDEVTTGMSPDARHLVWEVLKSKPTAGQAMPAVLLSTHYMDEAASLGTRIGIMIDGSLVTTGTLRWLQEKYCHCYFVEVALQHDAPDSANDEIVAAFSSNGMAAKLYEIYPYRFKMSVPFTGHNGNSRTMQLASIFNLLESNKEELRIRFYSVAQMNLEQIFIDLCRKQFEADEDWEQNRGTEEAGITQSSTRSRRNLLSRERSAGLPVQMSSPE